MQDRRIAGDAPALHRTVWVVLVAASSIGFSLVFACATPFVALATASATQMRFRDAATSVGVAWLGNQAIGFLVLGYPRTWDAFGWGAAIAAAALLATLAASRIGVAFRHTAFVIIAAFAAAFVAYEGALVAATIMLPSGASAFSPRIIAHILEINAGALVGLLVIHRLALGLGLAPALPLARSAAA